MTTQHTTTHKTSAGPSTGVAQALTVIIIALTLLASAGGLFFPEIYRDNGWVVPQNRGTDLVTLVVALPALVFALPGVRRGSARATLIWIGVLGYIFYVYTGASFAYTFNKLFLVYVALFSLSMFALVAAGSGLDIQRIQSSFDRGTPRRAAALFLLLLGLMLIALWLSQIIPFLTTGQLPESLILADAPTMFVYVLDLGFVMPLALLGAWWLWRREPWGLVLASFVLTKAATMGLALLGMTWFALQAGQPTEEGLAFIWVGLAATSVGMVTWFLRHCRG